jgi:2-phosphosulfolactate phosphatase
MAERGCDQVVVASDVAAARGYRASNPDVLLAGEQGGRAPEGFDFGNSPAAFAEADLVGRRVVFATTNGTRALHVVRSAPAALIACLRNRTAAAAALTAEARTRGLDVTVVCSGREGRFGLDDAYTAGAIVEAMLAGSGAAALAPTDAALAARTLFRGYPDPAMLLRTTWAGRNVIEIGLGDDLRVCAETDRSMLVPRVGERVRLLES